MIMNYGLIVIGGGPGGYLAAELAAKAGLSVCLFEKAHVGGTCLNVGCIPTKYLLDRATALEKIRSMTLEGILRNAGEFSFKAVMRGKEEAITKLRSGIESLLRSVKVEYVNGEASFKDSKTVVCNGKEYTADNIIIATGSSPVTLRFPGYEHCIDSTGALALKKVPKRLCIIGGGVIGLELGSAYMAYGSSVDIVELQDRIVANELDEASDLLCRTLKSKGMRIHTATKLLSVEKNGDALTVRTTGGDIVADTVVSAAGRRANTDGLCIEKSGVELNEKGQVKVDSYMRTNVDGIYAIGDVIGGYMLAHAAYTEANVAVDNILGKNVECDESVMPRCIYTIPPFAAVGMSRREAEAKGYETVIGRCDYRANGMAVAEGESGCVFALLDKKTRKTLGFACVGAAAPELISAASIAVERGYTYEDWRKLTVAHPSLSESLRDAVLAARF